MQQGQEAEAAKTSGHLLHMMFVLEVLQIQLKTGKLAQRYCIYENGVFRALPQNHFFKY